MQGISELPALLEFKNLLLHLPFSDISAYLGLEQDGSRAVFSSVFSHSFYFFARISSLVLHGR